MLIKHLAKHFEDRVTLPIEIPEIRDAVVALGVQDDIVFSDEDMDPALCRGAFYQFTSKVAPYAPSDLISLIVYSRQLEIPWQRMVCCKETVHVLDKAEGRTNKPDEVLALVDKLLGPLSNEDYGMADMMAASDRLALYQGLAVIFPPAARLNALKKIEKAESEQAKNAAMEQIAEWASVPLPLVRFALLEGWPSVREQILDC
jgi:hypothetical protein